MPVTYPVGVKTSRMQATADKINAGSGPGKLEIGTAGMGTILATFTLNDPCGTVSGAVLTFAGFPKTATGAATGTAAAARFRDSDNNDCATGLTVGLSGSGADVILGSLNIDTGLSVTLNAVSLTHAV